jgi:hypothetical protein
MQDSSETGDEAFMDDDVYGAVEQTVACCGVAKAIQCSLTDGP